MTTIDILDEAVLSRLSLLPQEPTRLVVPPLLEPLLTQPLKLSAVLVPLIRQTDGMHVLLTKRPSHLSRHPGQICFPGGRVDDTDISATATALREAREEIGLPEHAVKPLGFLPSRITTTGFEIKPLVGWIESLPPLALSKNEVEFVLTVPLAFFLDPLSRKKRDVKVSSSSHLKYKTHVYAYDGHEIWGATASIIDKLAEALHDR